MIDREKHKKSANKIWFVWGLILVVIFGVALALRVVPMHAAVFGSGWINFQGPDGIYHLRLVQNLIHNFPVRISFDPYTYFPYGQPVPFAPLYDYITAFFAWLIGLGSPSENLIETVAVYVPAVLGALVVVPVYFIARTLWNRTAGLISALIIGILPGTFLFRSRLGYFDHHVAEVFFSTLFIACLVLTVNYISRHPVTFNDILRKDWKIIGKPLLFSALTGIALGLYLLVWVGGLLFVFLFFFWALVMFILEHLRKQSTEYICVIGVTVFILALLVVIPFLSQILYSGLEVFSLIFGVVALLVMAGISKWLDLKKMARIFFPLSILGLGFICFLIIYLISPTFFHSVISKFSVFTPDTNLLTVAEARPWLSSQGQFTLTPVWSEFTINGIIAPIAFILLVVCVIREISAQKVLLILWSVLALCATLGQVRFTYYLAVVIALLCGYFYAEIVNWFVTFFKWLGSRSYKGPARVEVRTKHKQKGQPKSALEKRTGSSYNTNSDVSKRDGYKVWAVGLSLALVFMLGIYPNIQPAISEASSNAGISSEWRDSLLWMKDNTPEPFEDADFYYQYYQKPSSGQYAYPKSAYGVMAWWDYGHMITEVAHRIPNANPNQAGALEAAKYFVSQNEADANRMLDKLGTRYIIIDYDIAVPYSIVNSSIRGQKFYAMPTWAGQDVTRYCQIFYQQKEGNLSPVPLYFPEYYDCLVTRLYNFHGAAVVPQNSTTVISFAQQSGRNVIQSSQTFATYEEASQFLKEHDSSNYRIVGTSPFSCPVPLEKLAHYQEVFKSRSGITYNSQRTSSSYIEIFEYAP